MPRQAKRKFVHFEGTEAKVNFSFFFENNFVRTSKLKFVAKIFQKKKTQDLSVETFLMKA